MEAANREQAVECLERAQRMMTQGKLPEARKLIERAQRMCATTAGAQLMERLEELELSKPSTSATAGAGTQQQQQQPGGQANSAQSSLIHPAYQRRLLIVLAIVVLLLLHRVAGGDPLLAGLQWGLGRMPGDLNYSYQGENSSVHVFFPITTCIIVSLIANLFR